jgi:uncharacterized OsmC-like protein
MVGTFGGALVARNIVADGKLLGEVRGEVEKTEDGVLIIKRIHIELKLKALQEHREVAERLLPVFAKQCPLYRSVNTAIEVTSSFTLVPEP